MRTVMVAVVALGLAASAHGAERVDELFATWLQAQRGAKSLVAQLMLIKKNKAPGATQKFTGKLQVLRNAKGELFASYDVVPVGTKGQGETFLFVKGATYRLDHATKTATRYRVAEGEM